MASDTVTRRLEQVRAALSGLRARLPGLLPSRVAGWILGVYAASFLVLVLGMAGITENRRGLVEAKIVSLSDQAEFLANVLAEAAIPEEASEPVLDPVAAREVLSRLQTLYVPDETRALIHTPGPELVADSSFIAGEIEQSVLPPPGVAPDEDAHPRGLFGRAEEAIGRLFASPELRALLDRSREAEVTAALETAEPQSGIRRAPNGARIVSVTVPVAPIKAVVGTVTYESYDLEALIAAERYSILPYIAIAGAVMMLGAILLTRSIARPIRRLAGAADKVRRAGGRRVELPDFSGRKDEIGELGRAFTGMTNALYDRLDAIESFAADVSHEIKNPLASIRSAAEILPIAKDPEKRERLIRLIEHDVKRLDRLVTDISNASRLDAELSRETVGRIDLKALLTDIANLQRRDARREIAVTVDAAPGLMVAGHEGPLSRVFLNLVENAATFSPEGGQVRVSARRAPGSQGRVRVVVDDDGPGIPEENLQSVFERFYTKRPEGAAFGGHSGLGLAIVQQIVTAHAGRVWAENRTGPDGARLGARFVVELPGAD
ncbi:MAG: stimulus-sensing domain-containing protein [Oceanicaulis sp.]